MNNSMINPPILNLLEKVDNRYSLVIVTSKRARQLINGSSSTLSQEGVKPLTLAINEVNEGLVQYEALKEGTK